MDKETRGAIERATQKARRLLEAEFREQLEGKYDVLPSGEIPADGGPHLSPRERLTREKVAASISHKRAAGMKAADAVQDYLRDAAFTTLNRFVALKMLEERELVQECVSKGDQSNGFREFCMLAPGTALLPDGAGYRLYVECVFDELSREVKVLFDRRDVAAALWPRRAALADLLEALNAPELAGVWRQDETIGWVYQYFNTDADREAARYDADGKPRPPENSRDLAVRNQFFTPRYVVEFLADNTLGRTWFEMRQGHTAIRDHRYFVWTSNDPIPAREKKDPRDLRVIDPACGSGHFLLYAFDLLVTIYEEAWEDGASPVSQTTGRTLRDDYPDHASLERELPGQIIRNNLHGIDIDERCVQIAALALWMRAQRAYQEFRIERDARHPITRTNIVVAEPMPGEADMVEEFAAALKPAVLGDLFRALVETMHLAGDLGSLLKIENALETEIKQARQAFEGLKRKTLSFDFAKTETIRQAALDFSDLTNATFFDHAEELILDALNRYVESVAGIQETRRRLFAGDAQQGMALLNLLQQRYDVVMMNPPFGDSSDVASTYIRKAIPSGVNDIYASMVLRGCDLLTPGGTLGAITSRAFVVGRDLRRFRGEVLAKGNHQIAEFLDLGMGVLDGALVETAAFVLRSAHPYIAVLDARRNREAVLASIRESAAWQVFPRSRFQTAEGTELDYELDKEQADSLGGTDSIARTLGRVTKGLTSGDDPRFVRLRWELPSDAEEAGWWLCSKGGGYEWFGSTVHLLVKRHRDGAEMAALSERTDGNVARTRQSSAFYGRAALTWSCRSQRGFSARRLREGICFTHKSGVIVPARTPPEEVIGVLSLALASAQYLVMINSRAKFGSFETGPIARLPVPDSALEGTLAWRPLWDLVDQWDSCDETSQLFLLPARPGELDGWRVDLTEALTVADTALGRDKLSFAEEPKEYLQARLDQMSRFGSHEAWWSYALGLVFGRWRESDVAACDRAAALPSPLARLGISAPAQRHARESASPARAILVDDPGGSFDLVTAISDVAASKGIDADADTIRRWVRTSLWSTHLKDYSRSKRTGPIYWRLGTPSGSYSVWLYYMVVTKDTLYAVLNDHVSPKLHHEERRLESLRTEHGPNPTSSQRGELEAQEIFVSELRAFREELTRVAPLWKPDLSDGVMINFAPLWRLVPQDRDWQKSCRECWDALAIGQFDWSHMAMRLWPNRVLSKCQTDRSLAIAHELENIFWVEQESGKWKIRSAPTRDPEEIAGELTSPAMQAALESLVGAPSLVGKPKDLRAKSHKAEVGIGVDE